MNADREIINKYVLSRNSFWAFDVLCDLGFCLCDPKDPLNSCNLLNEVKGETSLATDTRIPSRFKKMQNVQTIYRKRQNIQTDRVKMLWRRAELQRNRIPTLDLARNISVLFGAKKIDKLNPNEFKKLRSYSIEANNEVIPRKNVKIRKFSFSGSDIKSLEILDADSKIAFSPDLCNEKTEKKLSSVEIENNIPSTEINIRRKSDPKIELKNTLQLPIGDSLRPHSVLSFPAIANTSAEKNTRSNSTSKDNGNRYFCLPPLHNSNSKDNSTLSVNSSSRSENMENSHTPSRNEFILPLNKGPNVFFGQNKPNPRISITLDQAENTSTSSHDSNQIKDSKDSLQDNFYQVDVSGLTDREILMVICKRLDVLSKSINTLMDKSNTKSGAADKSLLSPVSVVYSNPGSPVQIFSHALGNSRSRSKSTTPNPQISSSSNNILNFPPIAASKSPTLLQLPSENVNRMKTPGSAVSSNKKSIASKVNVIRTSDHKIIPRDVALVSKEINIRTISDDVLARGNTTLPNTLKYSQIKSPSMP